MIGTYSGVAFIDVTKPTQPRYIGKLPPPARGKGSNWRSIKVRKDYAYMVSEAGTMQYINMSNVVYNVIPLVPQQGIILTPYAQEYRGGRNHRINKTHSLYINEESGFAYLAGSNKCSGGLYMVDLRIPNIPVFAGCYGKDGYTHEVQCKFLKKILRRCLF